MQLRNDDVFGLIRKYLSTCMVYRTGITHGDPREYGIFTNADITNEPPLRSNNLNVFIGFILLSAS